MKFTVFQFLLSAQLVLGLGFASSAGANLLLPYDAKDPRLGPQLHSAQLQRDDGYRIGDEWGKTKVTQESLENETEAFARASKRTALLGGGTGFYIGTFNGYHVMATNHHVLPNPSDCRFLTANFPLLEVSAKCETVFGTWTDVDLALFAVKVDSEEDLAKLEANAENFDFASDLEKGQMLLTVGFGVGFNPARDLVANQDSDCKVFSDTGDYQFMADPDEWNPGPYRAWSFANGCDVSHGDSGSAMVDRESGRVVGIIWTGKIPKSSRVQSSSYLDQIFEGSHADIWTELSYAVPSPKIADHLESLVASGELDPEVEATLISILED